MIRIEKASKAYIDQVILDDATWQINPRTITGLVGPNGTGKTTLLRLILEQESLDGGSIIRANRKSMTVGHLPQNIIDLQGKVGVLDFVLTGRQDLLDIEAQLKSVEERLSVQSSDALLEEQATLIQRFEQLGGYTYQSEAKQILVGMGFSNDSFSEILNAFSGGWRMRALLARILLKRPQFLLLDEPTNHLDSDSLGWLESFLKNYEGAIVIVSHDRYFLNAVTNKICELEFGKLNLYHTNYDGYRKQKAEDRERLENQKMRQDKEILRIQRFIERFRYKSTKSKAVQSRVKMLDKMDRVQLPQDEEGAIQFSFPNPPRMPKIIAELENASKRFDSNIVYENLDFKIFRGDKIALVGPNGGGKTTLLKMIAGIHDTETGTIEIGDSVKIAYFAQHAADALLPNHTVEESILSIAEFDDAPKVRNVLGAFGFSGDDVKKKINVLSGGEKNRVALGQMLFRKAGLLLLDEPTNHLDIQSRQVLEYALRIFQGAYIVVSHDRYFVNEVADRIVHVDRNVHEFLGSYDDYLASLKNTDEKTKTVSEHSRKKSRQESAELRKKMAQATKKIRKTISDIEEEIAVLEQSIEDAERCFAKPDFFDDAENATRMSREYKENQTRTEQLLEQWERLEEEVASIEGSIQ